MNLKSQITSKVAEILGYPTDPKSLKTYLRKWWANPRNKEVGGLKLTSDGFNEISKAQIKFHKIRLDGKLQNTNQNLIKLDQYITCPGYINKFYIHIFDDKMAVQFVLFSGNLQKFITAKTKSKNKT